MDEELDPEVIKATQTSLGKYIKRPPLSEKLLKKPPFRFLHDIITSVLKTTGFFEGLFDENELISDNVKDRESKISFLNKAITIICATTGRTLSVKPSKIVAGQEATKTNELLQCLAFALNNNLTSHEAVKKYKDDIKKHTEPQLEVKKKDFNKGNKKSYDSKKSSSKSLTVINHKQKSSEVSVTKKDKEKANDTTKKKENGAEKKEPRNKNIQPKSIPKKNTSELKLQSQSTILINENKSLIPRSACDESVKPYAMQSNEHINDENRISNSNGSDNNREMESTRAHTNESEITSIPEMTLSSIQVESVVEIGTDVIKEISSDIKSFMLKTDEPPETENIIQHASEVSLEAGDKLSQTTQLNPMVPKAIANDIESFIKSAPELEDDKTASPVYNTNIIRSASLRPSSSRPGAPRPKEKFEILISNTDSHLLGKVNIIAEHEKNEDEDESSIIVIDKQESLSVITKEIGENVNRSGNEYGHLVQQILDSQKEFSQATGKTEIEWHFGAQKAMVAQQQEVESLRYNIQALTRVTNPLGKLLDHIQEDVEVMRQELQQWSNIYEEVSKEIQKENELSKDSLLPLYSKLKQLKSEMQEKSEKINDLKMLIHKNSSRIDKLLSSGNVQ